MWRTEDGARRGEQVLIAYFLGFEQQRVVFAKCRASSRSAAGLNWSLLLAAGNMQIKMSFGKPLEYCAAAARTLCICQTLVWCFNKDKFIQVLGKKLVLPGAAVLWMFCIIISTCRCECLASSKAELLKVNLNLLFLPNDVLISPLFSLSCVTELCQNLMD